jgi:hypothetical protein
VIGHLCLIDFILFRHLKLNGLEPEIGSGVCLCVGKVLGTPRHPFKKMVTSLLVFPLFAKPRLLVLIMNKCPKFGRAIYQEWQIQFDLIWF